MDAAAAAAAAVVADEAGGAGLQVLGGGLLDRTHDRVGTVDVGQCLVTDVGGAELGVLQELA